MIPNTIPPHYVREPTLRLPLTIKNNQSNPWPIIILTICVVLALLYFLIIPNGRNPSLYLIFLCISPFVILLCLYITFKFFEKPSQNILIEPSQITVKSRFGKAKTYATNTLDHVSFYSDRYLSNDMRFGLFGLNIVQGNSSGFFESLFGAFFKAWFEWCLFIPLDKTKIAISTKGSKDLILFDVPAKNATTFIQDLGLLLKIPAKL